MLFGRVVGVAKKLLLQRNVTRADNVNAILPGAVTERGSASPATVFFRRSTPASSRVGTVPTPSIATSVGCDMATAGASILGWRSSEGIVTTKRGCGRAGVVPAVPGEMESQYDGRDGKRSCSPSGGKRGCRGSPLLVSHMRGDVSSSSTIYAQRSCERSWVRDECCAGCKS